MLLDFFLAVNFLQNSPEFYDLNSLVYGPHVVSVGHRYGVDGGRTGGAVHPWRALDNISIH
jgi:hypothetical protein